MIKLTDEPHATARKYLATGHAGTFAFITTMSDQFCGDCNRIRLTADGKMKNCLFGKEESTDHGLADADKIENRSMVSIGG